MKVSELFESKKSPNEGHSYETFQAWKTDEKLNPQGYTSFDRYKEQFDLDEYEVHEMDPNTKNSHPDDSKPLFSSDSMSDVEGFAYEAWEKNPEGDYGIYQLRNNGYAGRYRTQAHDRQKREKSGRFGKKITKDSK